jgi:hypothetical protein
MTLKELRELFYNGYDDKARINLSTGFGDEFLEDIRINNSILDSYDDRKVVGLAQLINVVEVIIK